MFSSRSEKLIDSLPIPAFGRSDYRTNLIANTKLVPKCWVVQKVVNVCDCVGIADVVVHFALLFLCLTLGIQRSFSIQSAGYSWKAFSFVVLAKSESKKLLPQIQEQLADFNYVHRALHLV